MAKLRRTLLIGLGGTGFKAILNAKKMFWDNYGEIPPMIGFLGIDTDAPGFETEFVTAKDGTRITLANNERLPICVDEPREIYERNVTEKIFDWIPQGNINGLTTLSKGAGQMRSNGRFAITVNESKVEQMINGKFTAINDARIIDSHKYGLLGADTEVHIVFSLGGGTGSGIFINTAYLIKRLLPGVKISGYAVLPDVFKQMAPGAMTSRVRTNGKGAIIDLDYLAHLGLDSEPVELKWLNHCDKIKERPFTALYLIDNRNDNNDTFSDVKPLCEMISLAIVTSVGQLGVTLDSVSDNVDKLISDNAMDVKNKKAWVAGFGCAEIVFDGNRLARIYTRKALIQLVNSMLNGGCDDPAVIANNWFDNNHIRENQGKDDVIDYFMSPMSPHQFSEIDDADDSMTNCREYLGRQALEKQSRLDDALDALKKRIDDALVLLLREQANRPCGVFLCNQILHSILIQIAYCEQEMKEEKEALEDEMPRLQSALETACHDLSDIMKKFFKLKRKDAEEHVIETCNNVATRMREIERRKMALRFYSWLRERIGKSIDKVDIMVRNLETVRTQSAAQVQRIQRETAGTSFFQFDLAADLASSVECPLDDIVFNNFVSTMKSEGGIAAIAGMTSEETEQALMRFVSTMPKVKEYSDTTIDQILDKLTHDELEALLNKAIRKSLPLLPYSYRGHIGDLKTEPVEYYYVGVANESTSRLAKDNLFQSLLPGNRRVRFSDTGLTNHIIIYRQLGVIPAMAVKSLDNYASEYEHWEEDKPYGSHWDNTLCERMKRERFSLEPRTVNANVLDLWVQGIVFGLITFNAVAHQYRIRSKGMGGRALRGWLVDMGQSRCDAYRYLEDNIDILGPEIRGAVQALDVPGPENQLRLKSAEAVRACSSDNPAEYLEHISQCPIPISEIETYENEASLIEKEVDYILNNYR